MIFQSDHQLYEVLLCACTELEEERWKTALCDFSAKEVQRHKEHDVASVPKLDFLFLQIEEIVNRSYPSGSFDRGLFIQTFSKLTPRTRMVPVIIKNTYIPLRGDPVEPQFNVPVSSNRSYPRLATNAAQTLGPERSDRTRMEQAMSDVWTRNALPFPAMTTSRSGQLFRASNSMMRRLSKVSITSSPTKRSTSQRSRASIIDPGLDGAMDDPFVEHSTTMGPQAPKAADLPTELQILTHSAYPRYARKVSFSDYLKRSEQQKLNEEDSDTSTIIGKMSEEGSRDKPRKPKQISRALSKEKIKSWFS